MSFRDVPDPPDAFRRILRDVEARLRRLETGSVLRGVPSVTQLRIGDLVLAVDDSAAPTLKLTATNTQTGNVVTIVTVS